MPLRLMIAVPLVEELLVMVSFPVTAPTVVGSNCTFNVAVWPGFNVTGNVTPDIVKPVPVRVAALTVTGELPEEVSVKDWVAGALTTTLPKATLVELMLRVGMAAVNCRAKVFETPPALAVSVAACEVLNDETVAVKLALAALAGTVTVAGTTTAALLLDRPTASPPLPDGEVSVTVQASVPGPVIDALLQVSALNAPATVVPVPLRLIAAVGLVEELLETVSMPVNELA